MQCILGRGNVCRLISVKKQTCRATRVLSFYVLCNAETPPVTKRIATQPREGYMLVNVKPETITAIPYDIIKEGLQ